MLGTICSTIVALAAFSGCGTMANMDGREYALIDFPHYQPKPFGGVQRDFVWVSQGFLPFALDLPFSVVGDIVTLPRVLTMAPIQVREPLEPTQGNARYSPASTPARTHVIED
jgi:hypothetical protein